MKEKSQNTVLLLSPALNTVSGVATHVRMLMASDLACDYQLVHFQTGSEGRRENIWQKFLRFVISPIELALLLSRSRVNIVHLNTSLNAKAYWRDFVYLIIAKLLGRRVVNQIHGGWLPQEFFQDWFPLRWMLKRFLLASDVVTVLSQRELMAYQDFDSRINARLVPNAIDPAGLADQKRSYNRDQPLRLAYVGRLTRTKGLFETIEALRQLKKEGRRFSLKLAGLGPDEDGLKIAVKNAALKDCIEFLGPLSGSEKYRLWLTSDIFVFPTYAEGLPYSLLEAMAAGCVPVATAVGAIPEVMQNDAHGLLIPVRDAVALAGAIATLDDNRARLVRMAEAGRHRVSEQYILTRLANDFRTLYDGLMSRPRPPVPSTN